MTVSLAKPKKKIVVGLGNPGKAYQRNRHNLGFMVINALAQRQHLTFSKVPKSYQWTAYTIEEPSVTCILAQPLTYMNNSGHAVLRLLNDCAGELEQLLVVVDDIDLPLGRIRLRPHGSDGGHRGLRSIIAQLGSNNFARLRLGIGPQGSDQPAEEFVLSDFRPEEYGLLQTIITTAADCVQEWVINDIIPVMNKYNALDFTKSATVEA